MDNSKPEKTAVSPFLLEEEADLLENRIDKGSSFSDIFYTMWKKEEWMGIVSENARQASDMKVMRILLHLLPRPVLRSVLMKRVAYDFCCVDSSNWDGLHKDTDAGAYVASIHIRNRGGKFLCLTEIKEVIKRVEAYADAVDAYTEDQLEEVYTPYTEELPRTRALLDEAMHIDDQYSTYAYVPGDRHPKPKFGSAGSRNIRLCRDMLQRWADLHEGDAAAFWRQAPLMVGNSGSRASRMLSHDPLGRGLEGAPKIWALTLSVVRSMGLTPLVVTVPLFTCWERSQVNPAEVLGTILARSMVSSYGFNVKQPGTWSGSVDQSVLDDAKWRIFSSEKSYLRENLALSNKVARALRDARCELEIAKKDLEEARAELRANTEALQAEKEAARKVWSDFHEHVKRTKPELKSVLRDLLDIENLVTYIAKRVGRGRGEAESTETPEELLPADPSEET